MAGRLIVESGRNYISHTEPESRSRLEDVLPPPYERLMGAIAGVRSSRPMSLKLSVNQKRLAEFCRQSGARRLAVFGSALRDDFRPDSDVDVLIEFEPGRTPGLRFFWMQEELSRLFGRTVDLHTPASLSRAFRSQVLSEAEDQYVAA